MIIEVNKDYKIEITEKNLIVKDKKLYNTETKQYEGVEGDIVSFSYINKEGKKSGFRGYVDGYTHSSHIKIRGVDNVYTPIGGYSIEHISTVTNSEEITNEELKSALEA